jgi:hypothetical protein
MPCICTAQTKIAVQVSHSGNDNVGKQYAFELKEAIRGSHSMRMVGDDEYPPRIKVMLVTLDVDERPPLGHRSAIADGRRFVLR